MPPAAINILFIGNSFTQRNDLPGMLAKMAAERKASILHQLIASVELRCERTGMPAGRRRQSPATVMITWCCKSKALYR
jgi:hypothetical protein